jgi:acyl carrier protein
MMRIEEKKEEIADPERWVDWDEQGRWRDLVASSLAQERDTAVGVRGIRDGRVASAVEAVRLLHNSEDEVSDVEQLRAQCAEVSGEDPDSIIRWAEQLGGSFCWKGFSASGLYEGVFRPQWREQAAWEEKPRGCYRRYGNAPARRTKDVEFGRFLRDYLVEKLPEYMVPAVVMVLPAFPLTPNGKVDRKALPSPELVATAEYRAPRTPQEQILCGLFAELLEVERVGLDDNFFELGGHSLMATKLVSGIRATLSIEVAIRTLFDSPTVEQLSSRLREAAGSHLRLEPTERPRRLPLSYAQQRLWFINQMEGVST